MTTAERITHRIALAEDQFLEARFVARHHGMFLVKHSANEYELRSDSWTMRIDPREQPWTLKELVNTAIREPHRKPDGRDRFSRQNDEAKR